MYKGTSPKIFKDPSNPRVKNCILELQPEVSMPRINPVYNGAEIISFVAFKIDKLVPR